MSVIGVPVKVLHEAEGHIVTIETTSGEVKLIINQTKDFLSLMSIIIFKITVI